MSEMRYICVCRLTFTSLSDLNIHQLTCEQCVSVENQTKPTNYQYILPKKFTGEKPTVIIKLIKKTIKKSVRDEAGPKTEPVATNLFGRKLPVRTKVPYLSRAVPLSTDHSFERCTCGAVFVTRVGKRQHQARFCKFNKNKIKNKTEDDFQIGPDENLEGDKFSAEGQNEIEQSVIKYENDGCVIFLQNEQLNDDLEENVI